MIKYCLKWAGLFFLAVSTAAGAFAQSRGALRTLGARFERVGIFSDGRALVTRAGKSGYADTTGKVIIPLKYDYAKPFCNRFAVVGTGLDDALKCGLVDLEGREVAPFAWDGMGDVGEGVAVAYKRGADGKRRYALIDTLGNVREVAYDFCGNFSNGLAVAGNGAYEETVIPMTGAKWEVFAGKCGYITPDGREAIPVQFDDARAFSDDSLAAVGKQGKYYIKWGFIDKTGQTVVPCVFYSVEPFRRDRAVVSRVVDGNLAYGYIDRSGREVIPCRFASATSFEFPNAWVGVEHEGETIYLLIDDAGNQVVEFGLFNLQDGGKYGQAAGAVRTEEGLRYGIIDNDGAQILPFEYDEITLFSEWDAENRRWQESAMATKEGRNYSFNLTQPEHDSAAPPKAR